MSENLNPKKIAVLGAGSWGTALAHHLAASGFQTTLWGRDADTLADIRDKKINTRYFPSETLADSLQTSAQASEAISDAKLIVFAVPSAAVRALATSLSGHISAEALLVSTAKGLEQQTLATMIDVLSQELGHPDRFSVLAGPSFALELLKGLPTAVTLASTNELVAKEAAKYFHHRNLRVYTSTDTIGVEFGGVIKNIVALAAGLVDGIGMGNNARAALITRGLAEMQRLIVALGGEEKTVSGLSGLGDLLLTATGDLSRNRQVGLRLGRGERLESIVSSLGQVAEAVQSTKFIHQLAEQKGVSIPIIEQVLFILEGQTTATRAVDALFARTQKSEVT